MRDSRDLPATQATLGDRHAGLAADDLDRLVFRRRAPLRPMSKPALSTQWAWLAAALIGAVVFGLLMRTLLERTAGSAGQSSDVAVMPGEMPPAIGALPSDSIPVRDSAPSTDVGGPSQVSMVYRCVGKHGAVSLQSQPCAAGERVTRAIFAPPDAEPLPRPTFAAPNVPSVAEYTDAAPAVDDARDRRRRECANAMTSREATLARVGLARTYDLLHQLDAMVQGACKGL